jgi:membrane associated rhomboid family serine protease
LLHLLFNMLMHLFCGRAIESIIGGRQFVILYIVGAYVAAAAQYAVEPLSAIPMVGASGAISAVLGAYSMLFGRNKVRVASPALATFLNSLWLMAAWVGLQLILGFTFGTQGIMIAIAAHIGGFIAGMLLAKPLLLLRYRTA